MLMCNMKADLHFVVMMVGVFPASLSGPLQQNLNSMVRFTHLKTSLKITTSVFVTCRVSHATICEVCKEMLRNMCASMAVLRLVKRIHCCTYRDMQIIEVLSEHLWLHTLYNFR